MLRFLVVISLLPTVASAQSSWSYSELSAGDKWIVDALLAPYKHEHELDYEAHASVSGIASTRYSGHVLAAGGEFAWMLGPCRVLHGGVEGTLQRDFASASVWGGGCLPSPFNRMTLTVRSDYQVQPSFASLPIALRSRYTGTVVDFTNTFIGWSGPKNDHEIFGIAVQVGQFEQPMLDSVHVSIGMHAYRRYTRETERAIDVVTFATRAAGPAVPANDGEGVYLSSSAFELTPLRLSRMPVGELLGRAVELDFTAGIGWGMLHSQLAPDAMATNAKDLFGAWALRATQKNDDDDFDTFSLSMHRKFEPTYTEELLLDTRGEAGWTRQIGKNTFALGAFAAHTRRYAASGTIDTTPSGGGRAAYMRRLPYKLRFTISGEVARSFFARLDETRAEDTAWSGQAGATLSFATADD